MVKSALGRAGDVLLCINSGQPSPNLQAVLAAATARQLGLVVLTHAGDRELPALIGDGDVLLRVEADARAQIIELHTMLLNCLHGLIDRELFGDFARES